MVEPLRPYFIPRPEQEEIEEKENEFPETRLTKKDEDEVLGLDEEDITGISEDEAEFPELEFTEADREDLFGTGEPKPKRRIRLKRQPAIRRYPLPPNLGGMNV